MSEILNGTIARINYYNQDSGYTVALFELDYKKKDVLAAKNKIIGNNITVVGFFDRAVYEGEEYELEGDYVKDKNYGLQFKFTKFARKAIDNAYGIVAYLSSDLFPGIGIRIAKMVVEKLGVDAIELIKHNPDVLNEIAITPKQRSIIYSGILSDKNNQEAVIFLLDHGITIDMANKIIIKFGSDVIEELKTNPYILMDKLDRFGFKKNDQFALKLGIPKNSKLRLKALTCYMLKELIYNSGNSYVTKTTLYERIREYILEEIAHEDFVCVLKTLEEEKKIYMPNDNDVFDYQLYIQETDLAKEIVKLLKGERNPEHKMTSYDQNTINDIYEEIEKESSIKFNEEQKNAITSAFSEPIVIVTGGPGTGKSTIVHAIIKMYLKLNKDSSALINEIAILAPTGRAAKRLKETTGMDSSTIHRFLGYIGGDKFTYNKYNKTTARLIIVDESSMMDLSLAYRLLTSMHDDARLIVVGDVDQLPAVGPGQVLKDLIDTREIKTIRLNKIHRQAENSTIIKLAHSINEGYVPENILEKFSDRTFIPTDNDHLANMLVDLVGMAVRKGKDIKKDIQVLIPMYKGDAGINEINTRIQNLINPLTDEGEIKHLGMSFRINDKVIQLVNRADKGVMNGDIGVIERFKYKNLKINGITVLFDSGYVEYNLDEIEDLSLAYAISIHKAQGSEFDLVIMPISTKYYIMLKRKLIYTGVTRAKNSLILIGDVKALQMGIMQIEHNRKTILKDKIIEYLHNGLNEEKPNLNIIDDESAFDSIGEKEFGNLKPSDFEDL
ncbi:MAG: ATP-dependent RecD-like DNA helicase [Mollicutes bacterium]|nr:ATP-dependent RecD-like DNA helicase [Mollicutes bacterium]